MELLISCQQRESTAYAISVVFPPETTNKYRSVTCPLAKLVIKKTLYLVHTNKSDTIGMTSC